MFGVTQKFWNELDRQSLSFSEELNSKHFYNELERLNNFSTYKEKCEPFLIGIRGRKAVINTCAKLLYYLKTSKKLYMQNAQYDLCPLLNYWIYSKLNTILNSHDSTYIKLTFGKIVGIWNNFIDDELKKTKNETCEPMSNIVAYEDWKKRKELYEYYVDYSPIYQYHPYAPDRCKEFYHYVESKKTLYEHFKKFCYPDKKNGCPKLYTKYEEYHPDKVLSTLDCHQKIMDERAAAERIARQRGNTPSDSEAKSRETSDGMIPFGPSNLNGKSQAAENVGNIFLGVVATSMTSGALYRFTPLGNMLRNRFGWNTNNMSNINGGDIRLYDYASESFNPYSGGAEEHYIGYHPA